MEADFPGVKSEVVSGERSGGWTGGKWFASWPDPSFQFASFKFETWERLGEVEREGGLKEDGAKWGVQRAHHD